MAQPLPIQFADDDPAGTSEAQAEVLALRHPGVPTTLSELAAKKGEALEILQARVQIIATLRAASIRATYPEDWLLFKAPSDAGGQVVGYCQDGGCDRFRDLWGIEVFNVTRPEKVAGTEPATFHYIQSGDGRCKLTGQTVEAMEGGRSSTDDFCRDKTGADLELSVRKACRANLDGCITRELAGMKSVPLEELRAAWTGTNKKVDDCRLGRGFGSRSERLGGRSEKGPDVEPPVCPHCKMPGTYRPAKGDRAPFYGCKNWDKQGHPKWTQDAADWIAQQAPRDAGQEG